MVATIKTVKQNGAYVDLDEYEGIEGFIFIGEIASGWVKNIRGFVREGQRVILQGHAHARRRNVPRIVSQIRFRGASRADCRNGKTSNAQQLLKVLGEKVGWSDDDVAEQSLELIEAFGGLYAAFEEAAMQEGALENAGLKAIGWRPSSKSPLRTSSTLR